MVQKHVPRLTEERNTYFTLFNAMCDLFTVWFVALGVVSLSTSSSLAADWGQARHSCHPHPLMVLQEQACVDGRVPCPLPSLGVIPTITRKQDAEESHTAVGVHKLAPRPGEQPMEIGGRGVLEQTRPGGSGGGRGGEYELVGTREESEREEVSDPSGVAGIRRVVKG